MTNLLSNPEYWNQRYEGQGAEGSGKGSAGKFVDQKADFIRSQMRQYGMKSVFDYGCGNGRVLSSLEGNRLGYDFSPSVVASLQSAQNETLSFTSDSQAASPDNMKRFDTILCLEVLLHNTAEVRKQIMDAISEAYPRLFIFTDSNGGLLSRVLLAGSHIDPASNADTVASYFPEYIKVASQGYRGASTIHSLVRRDVIHRDF